MRLSHIEIENFRSFGPGGTRIDFPGDENLAVILGANNAGKSNLVDALRLVLGQLRRYDADPADFHMLDVGKEMTIELRLRTPIRRETMFRQVDEIWGFRFRAWQLTRAPDRGQLRTEHRALDADGNVYRAPTAVRKPKDYELDPDVEPVRGDPAPAADLLRLLGPVHYLSPDLRDAFRVTGRGPLARVLDLYRDDFRSTGHRYTVPTSGEEISRVDAFQRLARRMEEILHTERLAAIEQTLSSNLKTFLGPDRATAAISLALPEPEELLRSILRLRVQDDPASPVVPIERLGAGYRSLLRVAILQTYADLLEQETPAVFLFEEPEAYLHPHLRRFLRRTLRRLADASNDVIIATHDPGLVSIGEYGMLMRLAKRAGQTEVRRCTESLDFSYERAAQKLRGTGNEEMLFAEKVVLCEGQDDVAATKAIVEGLDLDLDAKSISVIDCGGQGNLPDYVRLLDALGIECMVVADGDQSKIKTDASKAKLVQAIQDLAGERVFLFEEDVEHALGTEKRKDNPAHLVAVIENLDLEGLPEDHELRILRGRLDLFAGGRSPGSSADTGEHASESGASEPT